MKRAYESFTELADDFTEGGSITHHGIDHSDDPCIAWQRGVKSLAAHLDAAGLTVPEDFYDKFWEAATERRYGSVKVG